MFNQNKIKSLLEKINWLSDSFEKNNYSNISSLEKSLLKEKVLMFFDEIENIPTSVFKPKDTEQTIAQQEEVKKEIVAPEIVKVEEVKEKPIVEKQAEPIKIEEPIVVEKKEVAVSVQTIETELSKQEKFEKTLKFQKEIAMPKRDIREIIDLNKSFILKAELFNQNNDLYNSFIQEINQTRTEDSANIVIKNWAANLNWKTEENKAFELLEKAVEKRFLPLI